MANYAAWPFGRELIDKPNAGIFSLASATHHLGDRRRLVACVDPSSPPGISALHHDHRHPAGDRELQADPEISLMPLGKQIVQQASHDR